jgi:hypothetical protein
LSYNSLSDDFNQILQQLTYQSNKISLTKILGYMHDQSSTSGI